MRRQFALWRFTYRTKGEAVAAIQRVLHSAPLGLSLQGDDLDLVTALVPVIGTT